MQLQSEFFAGSFDRLHSGYLRGRRGIPHNAYPRCSRHGFLQHLQRLGIELTGQFRQPSDVAAGPRQARHMTGADGIGMVGEHDGNGFGRLSRGSTIVEDGAKMTSTFMRTSSAASSGNC